MKNRNRDLTQISDSELYSLAFEVLFRSLNNIKVDEKHLTQIFIESEERGTEVYEKALFDAELAGDSLQIKRHEYLNPAEKAYFESENHFELVERHKVKSADYGDILYNLDISKGNLLIITVSGDSMTGAGFNEGDLLYVDLSQKAGNNNIVIAKLNGVLYVKRLKLIDGSTWLYSENSKYEPYRVKSIDEFNILGVVKSVSKKVF